MLRRNQFAGLTLSSPPSLLPLLMSLKPSFICSHWLIPLPRRVIPPSSALTLPFFPQVIHSQPWVSSHHSSLPLALTPLLWAFLGCPWGFCLAEWEEAGLPVSFQQERRNAALFLASSPWLSISAFPQISLPATHFQPFCGTSPAAQAPPSLGKY